MSVDRHRGNDIHNVNGVACYFDGKPVRDEPDRACGFCRLPNTAAGHDGCLGTLPGVMNACCGHGQIECAYVQSSEWNGLRIPGAAAIKWIEWIIQEAKAAAMTGTP